jgi:hypothetical protein
LARPCFPVVDFSPERALTHDSRSAKSQAADVMATIVAELIVDHLQPRTLSQCGGLVGSMRSPRLPSITLTTSQLPFAGSFIAKIAAAAPAIFVHLDAPMQRKLGFYEHVV